MKRIVFDFAKKTALIIYAVSVILPLCGCTRILPSRDVGERIYSSFSSMQSYCAEIKITVYSNKNKNTYDAVQYYKSPDKMRSENGNVVTVINGQTATVKNSAAENPLTVSQISEAENDFMFLQNFFGEYYKNESSSAEVTGENGDTALLKIHSGIENDYKTDVELTLNTKTMQPVFLEIKGGNRVYIHIDYLNFKLNEPIDDGLFEI